MWPSTYQGSVNQAANAAINPTRIPWRAGFSATNPAPDPVIDPNQQVGTMNGRAYNAAGDYITGGNAQDQTPSQYWVNGRNYGTAANYANTQKNEVNMMLDDQEGTLRKLLGSVGTQKTQGLEKLAGSYNTEKLAGENQYGQQFEDNTRKKMGALNKVDTNARTAANSLRRLLGLSGSANQSALKFAAPNAIARVASQERGDQIENFGLNERNITNAKQNFLDDLLAKKNERESEFLKGIAAQEQSINSDLADIAGRRVQNNGGDYAAVRAARSPFQATIDSKQSEIDNLFNKYNTPFNANKTLATLNQFNVDQAAINANKGQGGAQYSPYSQFIKRKVEQDYA